MDIEITPYIRGKNYFRLLFLLFVLFELATLATFPGSNGEAVLGWLIIGGFVGIFYFLVFIGIKWAKWPLSIVVFFYGLLLAYICILDRSVLFLVGSANCFFTTFFIHVNKNILAFMGKPREQDIPALNEDGINAQPEVAEDYPSLLNRVQATFVDSILAFILIGLFAVAADKIGRQNTSLKILAIFLGLSYEPLMTGYSRTIGQRMLGMRVVATERKHKPRLLNCYLRFIVKSCLGWLSFIIMFSNTRRRAIHDYAADTVVVKTS